MKKSNPTVQMESLQKEQIFKPRKEKNPFAPANAEVHLYGKKNKICLTDSRGYATPQNKSQLELVVNVSEGFIPLWAENVTLRWRFSPMLMHHFEYPKMAMERIEELLGKAILAWGDAAPVSFSKRADAWDFEISVRPDNCSPLGCSLARAFFPDCGRHDLVLYPELFSQSEEEQVETLIHELGHVFGLRHFFAEVKESAWPSVPFGENNPFTIMNYGFQSTLTEADKADLKKLYQMVWSGKLQKINGTKIVTVTPFHSQP